MRIMKQTRVSMHRMTDDLAIMTVIAQSKWRRVQSGESTEFYIKYNEHVYFGIPETTSDSDIIVILVAYGFYELEKRGIVKRFDHHAEVELESQK